MQRIKKFKVTWKQNVKFQDGLETKRMWDITRGK